MQTSNDDTVLSQDLAFLIGSELIQIVLDPYEVRFVFDGGTEIRSAFRFEIDSPESDQPLAFLLDAQPRPAFDFYRLVLRKVTEVDAEADDRLVLTLDSGDTLTLLIDGRSLESLSISRYVQEKGGWVPTYQRFF